MEPRLLFCMLFCWNYVSTTLAAKILVLSPLGPRSHVLCLMPVVEELAERGHQLTVVAAHIPTTESANIQKIALPELVDIIEAEWYDFKQSDLLTSAMHGLEVFRTTMILAYDSFMANQDIKEIKQNKNFDLVIVDGIANDFIFPLVDHIGAPFIIYDPGSGAIWNLASKDVSREYALVPPSLGGYGSHMSFFQRMTNMFVCEFRIAVRKYFLLPTLDELVKKDFPNARPIAEIERDAQLCFVNAHPTTTWLRTLPATIIPIGASHTRPAKPLPKDLQLFADGAVHGLIIFTLGSNSKVSLMPKYIKKIFLDVFARLPQRVVWKWEKESDSTIPPNVKLVDWLPQQDLLAHNNTKLFIAHGGMMGNQEAIYHSVPILGLPLGRDQRCNLVKAFEEGFGLKLEWEDVTEELLHTQIQRLLNEPNFKANATRLSRIMRDELMPARKIAAYWVEHVLRHGGAQHLQNKAKNMPFYQIYLLDVWIFLISAICLILFVTFKLVAYVAKRCKSTKMKTQ